MSSLDPIHIQWGLLILFGIAFFFVAPLSKRAAQFFSAQSSKGKSPNVVLLTSSLVISWIFAKSITNSANLGLSYGIVGSISYAAYYLSFIVAGIVIYRMRVKGKFRSIHEFLQSKFGLAAVIVFSILIGFRLFNEVWSNTMVIGSYFGEAGTSGYYWSILVFTILTLAYTLKGGLRSSFLTDAIQMILFGVLLFIILGILIPDSDHKVSEFIGSGEWSVNSGLNLLFVAFLQVLSYPFHDSVMTDRGFVSDPKTTLRSFMLASVIGVLCLTTFGFVGVYAKFEGLEGQAAVEVSKLLGTSMMLMMNFIMITSAASTLDSAFSSFSKLMVLDLKMKGQNEIKTGRIMMVILMFAGTLPIFFNPEILSATTVSGTMVIGLAPVFLFWNMKVPKISFHLSIGLGIITGILVATDLFPENLAFNDGPYGILLSANLIGLILCCAGFFIPVLFSPSNKIIIDSPNKE